NSLIPVCITQVLEGVHNVRLFTECVTITSMVSPIDTYGVMWIVSETDTGGLSPNPFEIDDSRFCSFLNFRNAGQRLLVRRIDECIDLIWLECSILHRP